MSSNAHQNPVWYSSKIALMKANTNKNRVIFSKDVCKSGAKVFTSFPSVALAVEYAEAHTGEPLYEVVEHHNNPVYAFFDLDRPDVLFPADTVLRDFLSVLERFATNCVNFAISLTLGHDVHAADATSDVKTSLHIKCNFDFQDIRSHREFSAKLSSYIVANRGLYPSLVHDQLKFGAPKQICVVDCNVYTAFRSYRMLGMVKLSKTNDLKPIGGSSNRVVDHMIVRYDLAKTIRRFQDYQSLTDAMARLEVDNEHKSSPLRHSRRRSPSPTPPIVVERAAWYSGILNSWDSTADVFEAPVTVYTAQPAALPGEVDLRLFRGTVCPYAKRAHKSNNIYIRFREHDHCAQVVCYDEDCLPLMRRTPIKLSASDLPGAYLATEDGINDLTLHSQQDGIDWNEVYDEEAMRPLPDREIVCVRANMGVGKTVALIQLFKKVCTKHTKVLVISYNRSLSAQMAVRLSEQSGMEFTNYQDVQGPIQTPRIVVCLDSLARIHTSNFDYVIVDEATSVLKHFNSQHMASTGAICSRFELLALQAKRIYFLDAVIDATMTVAVVEYLSRLKCKDVHWIWNQYVRPSNREVTLIKGPMGAPRALKKSTITYAATAEIIKLLNEGQNVVVPSSTASYTKFLKSVLNDELPNVAIKVYNSDEPAVQLSNIHIDWPKFQCLIYSPTISAGVSFEGVHFDSLVAVLTNSRFTPPVDEALQQLWRVRNLTKGRMSIYLDDREVDPSLPSSFGDVKEMLDTNIAMAAKYCDVNFDAVTLVDGSSVKYDPSRLSYQIILGIVSSLNKSGKQFGGLLAETLTTDYKVPVITTGIELDDSLDLDVAKLIELASVNSQVDFDDLDVNLSCHIRDRIQDDLRNASDVDKASVRLYDLRNMYGVDRSLVDEDFYTEYVKPLDANDRFFAAKRFRDLGIFSLVENIERLSMKIEYLGTMGDDRNFDLFKNKSIAYHKILTSGHDLLKRVIHGEGIQALTKLESVNVHQDEVIKTVEEFLATLGKKEALDMRSTFDSSRAKPMSLFKRMLDMTFGLKVDRASANNKNVEYKNLTISHPWIKCFEGRYSPSPSFVVSP